jgi:predicted nucleotidyltransferase
MNDRREPPDLASRRRAYAQRLEDAARHAVETLSRVEGVRRVSAFGSFARGRRDLFTDLDLLVVWDTEKGPLDRLAALHRLLDVGVDLDLVCYTPGEFEAMRESAFLRQVRADERVLYAARPT